MFVSNVILIPVDFIFETNPSYIILAVHNMSDWKYIIRFEAEDGETYYAQVDEPLIPGDALSGYSTLAAAQTGGSGITVSVRKVYEADLFAMNRISMSETNW